MMGRNSDLRGFPYKNSVFPSAFSQIQRLIRVTDEFLSIVGMLGKTGNPDRYCKAAGMNQVLAFKTKFEANTVGLSMEVMTFLSNWLQGHIKGEDKKYTPCFNANGLK